MHFPPNITDFPLSASPRRLVTRERNIAESGKRNVTGSAYVDLTRPDELKDLTHLDPSQKE